MPAIAADVFADALPLAIRYVEILATRGVVRGLIGPREPARLWRRHVLNSVALVDQVPAAAHVVDLGSGAGLPGIPLALARPDISVTLVEPMQRRVDFLREVVDELGLTRVVITRARAEELPRGEADVVVARAVAPLTRLIPLALPLLRAGGRLLALKGENAATEVGKARHVLATWPQARVSVVSSRVGDESATIVRVDMPESGR
jgi:16S rRNA (guanine527-N7)-methyltransferase